MSTVPPMCREVLVDADPEAAFEVFTAGVGRWWPTDKSVYGPGGTVAFTDGQIVERSADGQRAVWGTVTRWEPPARPVLHLASRPGTRPGEPRRHHLHRRRRADAGRGAAPFGPIRPPRSRVLRGVPRGACDNPRRHGQRRTHVRQVTRPELPGGAAQINVESVALIPGTTSELGGGFTHAPLNPGASVVAVILQLGR